MSKAMFLRKRIIYCQLLGLIAIFYVSLYLYSTKHYEPEINQFSHCPDPIANDILPSAEDPAFFPGNHSIFFHETSCNGLIDSRKACAVESAARLHPERMINLLFTAPLNNQMLKNGALGKLRQFRNIQLARIHFNQYGKDTVIASILSWCMKNSLHPVEHAADILRILTLHKFGGVCLDSDVILVQSLEELPNNWVAKESDDDIANGAMGFGKDPTGYEVTTAILQVLYTSYYPKVWSYNGPKAIQIVLDWVCPDRIEDGGNCEGVEIFVPDYFYPVSLSDHEVYFKNGTLDYAVQPYMHHMWNYYTHNLSIEKDSPYADLAKQFCPTIFETYGAEFGE